MWFLASCSCKKQNAGLSSTAEALEKTQADLEKSLSAAQEEHQNNSSQLHSQLEQSKTRTKELQKEVKAPFIPKPDTKCYCDVSAVYWFSIMLLSVCDDLP